MTLVRRFLMVETAWAVGILVPMVAIALLGSEPLSAAQFLRWTVRALGLAAFPAGIAIAPAVFADARPWRQLILALAAASMVAAAVLVLTGLVGPLAGEPATKLPHLWNAMNEASENWETRNDAAWKFFSAFLAPLNALFFAAIGVQVGIWARRLASRSLQRAIYWAVGLGLLISGAGIWDTTYETIVLHTAAYVSFAAFYTILIPGSICAGLALPTLALLCDEMSRQNS